jgi:hypothetical protein
VLIVKRLSGRLIGCRNQLYKLLQIDIATANNAHDLPGVAFSTEPRSDGTSARSLGDHMIALGQNAKCMPYIVERGYDRTRE